jgi:hypothetical protein
MISIKNAGEPRPPIAIQPRKDIIQSKSNQTTPMYDMNQCQKKKKKKKTKTPPPPQSGNTSNTNKKEKRLELHADNANFTPKGH